MDQCFQYPAKDRECVEQENAGKDIIFSIGFYLGFHRFYRRLYGKEKYRILFRRKIRDLCIGALGIIVKRLADEQFIL